MLWYKGWLETRFRVLMVLAFFFFPVVLRYVTPRNANSTPSSEGQSIVFLAFFWAVTPVMLAGAGIKTQSGGPQATRGLHGSMYYTLTLPVSRFRLLAVRAGLGMLEVVAILALAPCAVWLMSPVLRAHLTRMDMFEYWLVISTCLSSFYFLGVLFATFLHDLAQNWTSFLAIFFLRWFFSYVPVPPSLNIFRAMGEASPLITHALPWATMAFSMGAAAMLFCAAAWVVQTREY